MPWKRWQQNINLKLTLNVIIDQLNCALKNALKLIKQCRYNFVFLRSLVQCAMRISKLELKDLLVYIEAIQVYLLVQRTTYTKGNCNIEVSTGISQHKLLHTTGISSAFQILKWLWEFICHWWQPIRRSFHVLAYKKK